MEIRNFVYKIYLNAVFKILSFSVVIKAHATVLIY